MAHIDLYQAFGLDQAASSARLRQVLTDRLDGANPAAQHQIETARAILSDADRRSRYDAQLADPNAPELDSYALDRLSGLWGTPLATPAATSTSALSTPMLVTIASLLVISVAIVGAVVINSSSTDAPAPVAQSEASHEQPASAESSPPTEPAPAPPAAPKAAAPVEGAYVSAGGPRPDGALPLPTYLSRYDKVTSAHLLTPSGGIGCDFQAAGADGKQGQCGVRSMNTVNSPLGTESIGSSTKGKWLFPFVNNHVGAPYGSTGTTGWMNQPANDGYQVPRVEYGKQYYFEDWAIASQENGLTVWNTTTGSGVFLSNEKAEAFDGPETQGPAPDSDGGPIVLGSMPPNGRGYGTAEPAELHSGGSPTSYLRDITWSSWGDSTAHGTGTGTYRVDGRVGREQYIPAIITVSDIGMCDGQRAYLKITWHFPSEGETASLAQEMRTCWN